MIYVLFAAVMAAFFVICMTLMWLVGASVVWAGLLSAVLAVFGAATIVMWWVSKTMFDIGDDDA